MITQCPSCQTRFRLPLDQVATSRGEVLCGECRAQFNALDYLVIEEGFNQEKPTLTVRVTQADDGNNNNTLFLPIDEDLIANLLSDGSAGDPRKKESGSDDGISVTKEPRGSSPSPQLTPKLTPIAQSATASITDTLLQQALQSAMTDGSGRLERAEEEQELPPETVARADKPSEPSATPNPRYRLPQGLEESPTDSPTPFWSGLLSTLFIGLLTATISLQYLIVQREHFSQHPYIRPILTTICPIIDCSVAPRRDLSQLTIVDNRIETHPRYADALLITADLSNLGPFEQNYPDVELVMTNIQQEVVASRHFYPAEYLPTYPGNGETRFAGNSRDQLMLEVVDPGSHATGFEFILHNSKFPK